MSEDFAERLCEQVENAHDADDLARVMPHIEIDLNDIRELMKCKIQTLDTAKARRAAFHLKPVDCLPMDLLAKILSFNHFNNMQCVCRSFRKCFEKNQENMKR